MFRLRVSRPGKPSQQQTLFATKTDIQRICLGRCDTQYAGSLLKFVGHYRSWTQQVEAFKSCGPFEGSSRKGSIFIGDLISFQSGSFPRSVRRRNEGGEAVRSKDSSCLKAYTHQRVERREQSLTPSYEAPEELLLRRHSPAAAAG